MTDSALGQKRKSGNKDTAAEAMAACAEEGAGGEEGGNWLVALAKAMGSVAGKHLQNAANLAKEINKLDTSNDEDAKKMTQMQAEMSAEAQLGNMMMQATSTVLKSIGEGLAAIARKQ